MFKKIVVTVIVTLCALQTGVAHAQFSGDECTDALWATDGPNMYTTISASPSMPEPDDTQCPSSSLNWNSSADVWFRYTAKVSGTHSITTCDIDSFDTSIALYEANCNDQIACNGDGPLNSDCQQYYSQIEFNLLEDIVYYIRIGGFNGATGSGTLTINPPAVSNSTVWYVDANNPDSGAGTDWASSFSHVQHALDVASSGDQIWVAQGTYRVVDSNGSNDPRDASFRLIAGVELYGGFNGTETGIDQRNPQQYPVFLTGDINGDDDAGGDNSENAYHVVIADNLIGLPPVIDGFYIRSGNANGSGTGQSIGGGLVALNYQAGTLAHPIVYRTNFIDNSGTEGGAIGIGNINAEVYLYRCLLKNNKATLHGGAIKSDGECIIESCLLAGNRSAGNGGAVYVNDGWFNSVNSTIVQNHADVGGGLYFNNGYEYAAQNTIIWGNKDTNGNNEQLILLAGSWLGGYNCIQNNPFPETTDVLENPRFLNEFGNDGRPGTGDENFRLMQLSPCIDAGESSLVQTTFDLPGNDRILDDPYTSDTGEPNGNGVVVDLGCYEHVSGSNDVLIWGGANSYYFYDSLNWIPQSYPDLNSNTLFNGISSETIFFDDDAQIDKMLITEGDFTFKLEGFTLALNSASRPLRVDSFRNSASATFIGGVLETAKPIELGGNIVFSNMTIDVGAMFIEPDAVLSFDGESLIGDVVNGGGAFSIAGHDIGEFTIIGTMLHQAENASTGLLVGSLLFDIAGSTPNFSYDHIHISSTADLSCSIDLRWNKIFMPAVGDSFDIISVGNSIGHPTVVYNSGLPSNLTTRWVTPTGLRGGGEDVIIETTGPILFDAGETTAITTDTPNDILVADLDGDSYPDVAMTVASAIGGSGNVVILWNNGVVDGVWQGFTEDTPISVGTEPMDIEVGDLNSDGTANDLIIANNADNNVSILANDNSGTFTKTDVSTDIGPMYIAIGDYTTNDGLALDDIVVGCSSFKASVLTNASSLRNRAISFSHTNSINIPSPGDIKPGDVNHDKDLDFVILDIASEEVRVLNGTGSGTTPAMMVVGSPLPNGSAPVQLAFSDLDRDGNDDAITVNEGSGSLSVLLGDVSDLGNTSSFNVGTSPQSMAVHDFDNDGDDDLVVSLIGDGSGERELLLIRNDTVSTVVLSAGDAFNSGAEPILVNHGDIDQDGLNDVVSVTDLSPLVGQNTPAVTVSFNNTAVVVVCPADLDGNGFIAVGDILTLISAWGSTNPTLDINESGFVDVGDILMVVSSWGPC